MKYVLSRVETSKPSSTSTSTSKSSSSGDGSFTVMQRLQRLSDELACPFLTTSFTSTPAEKQCTLETHAAPSGGQAAHSRSLDSIPTQNAWVSLPTTPSTC